MSSDAVGLAVGLVLHYARLLADGGFAPIPAVRAELVLVHGMTVDEANAAILAADQARAVRAVTLNDPSRCRDLHNAIRIGSRYCYHLAL